MPTNSTGFDAYEDEHNLIAEYKIVHNIKKTVIEANLVEYYLVGATPLPKYFKLLQVDGGYFQPFSNIVNFVFRIHPAICQEFGVV